MLLRNKLKEPIYALIFQRNLATKKLPSVYVTVIQLIKKPLKFFSFQKINKQEKSHFILSFSRFSLPLHISIADAS